MRLAVTFGLGFALVWVQAQYDYEQDTIWLDALEVAHFYYCINTEAKLYA